MNDQVIKAALLVASKAVMLSPDSFNFQGFNALGKLENLKFGTLRRDPKVGTVTFNIREEKEDGKPGASVKKWAYAAYLENILKKSGTGAKTTYSYDGCEVLIKDGVISKVK